MKALLLSLVAGLAWSVSGKTSNGTTNENSNKGVQYAGMNIAGCEFGCDKLGTCQIQGGGTPQCPPKDNATQLSGAMQIQHFVKQDKFNIFRLPVGWQYLVNDKLSGQMDPTFFNQYDSFVQDCLKTGAKCIIDVHNYARWNEKVVGRGGKGGPNLAHLWKQMALHYKDQDNVIFGLMNEPHDVDMHKWTDTLQHSVNAIRNAGAKTQMILLPGTDFTSAGSFADQSLTALCNVTDGDSNDKSKLIFDVHQYFDADKSGTTTECVTDERSSFEKLAAALRKEKRQAMVTELGGGGSKSCSKYICSALDCLNENSDVYLGWLGWGAGGFVPSYALYTAPGSGGGDSMLVQQCFAAKFHGGMGLGHPPPPPPKYTTTKQKSHGGPRTETDRRGGTSTDNGGPYPTGTDRNGRPTGRPTGRETERSRHGIERTGRPTEKTGRSTERTSRQTQTSTDKSSTRTKTSTTGTGTARPSKRKVEA